MKNISLLPEHVRNYQRTSMQRNTLVIVALIGMLVFVVIYLLLSLSLSKPQEDLKVLDQKKAGIQARISGLKQYEDALVSAKKKGALIVQAMGNNPDWSALFNELFNQLPSDV